MVTRQRGVEAGEAVARTFGDGEGGVGRLRARAKATPDPQYGLPGKHHTSHLRWQTSIVFDVPV